MATECDKNLRLERAQRADLELYRELSTAAEQRMDDAGLRVVQSRAKTKYGLGVPPVDARSVLTRHEPSWRTFAPGIHGASAVPLLLASLAKQNQQWVLAESCIRSS